MGIVKRTFRALRSEVKQSLSVMVVFFSMLILASGAISVRQAIINTDVNLRRQLPAIATIHLDEEAFLQFREEASDWVDVDLLTGNMIRDIGSLPQVRAYDYTAWGYDFFSESISRPFLTEMYLSNHPESAVPNDFHSLRARGALVEQFILRGTQNSEPLDVKAGLIQLVQGRLFEEWEIAQGASVALVSDEFLNENQLQLGDFLNMEHRIFPEPSAGSLDIVDWYQPENQLLATNFPLEIIGVFHYEPAEVMEMHDFFQYTEIINRIYVPNRLVESTFPLYGKVLFSDDLEARQFLEEVESLLQYENLVFLLHDPLLMDDFKDEVMEILPDFWMVSDLSNVYGDIAAAMISLNQIADGLLWGSLGASIIMVGLLSVFFLKGRKREMGIYLALGLGKFRLISQYLLEILLLGIIALGLSLGTGHLLASQISIHHLRHYLAASPEEEYFRIQAGTPESLGFRFEMSQEEMLASFDTSINRSSVLIFITISLGTILLSAIVPIIWVLKLKPKDILL